jgi:hypothetical protein
MNRLLLPIWFRLQPGPSRRAVESRAGVRRCGGDAPETRSGGCGRIRAAARAARIGGRNSSAPSHHQTFLVLVGGIAPAESDNAVIECDEAMVREGNAMGVLAEVAKRMLRPAEGTLRVHHPCRAEQRTKPGGERLRIPQRRECSVESEFVLRVQLEAHHKLTPGTLFRERGPAGRNSAASRSTVNDPEPVRRPE